MAEEQEPNVDPHFDELMLQLSANLQPAQDEEEATMKLSTAEVFERLQAFYPSHTYDQQMLAKALMELGFRYADPYRDLNFVWLFK